MNVMQIIATDQIGEIRTVPSELTYTLPDWATDSRAKQELAGGALLDAGCYCANAVRQVTGVEPTAVSAFQSVKASHQIDATICGLMHFPEDRFAYIAASMEAPFRFTLEIFGDRGVTSTDNLFQGDRLSVTTDGELSVERFDPIDRFQAQLEHFSACILDSGPPLISLGDSIGNTAALVALKAAAETGKVVYL